MRILLLLLGTIAVGTAILPLGTGAGAAERGARGRPAPLADAAEAGDWSAVARLLDQGCEVSASQADGMTALHWAVFRAHRPSVRRLIAAGSDVNAPTRYEVTPLAIACTAGAAPLARLLLEAGADPNFRQPGGVTPLLWAARTGNAATLRSLLDHGAACDAVERRGQTALMWAAAEGHREAVDVLLRAGADAGARTGTGFTALMFAAREGRQPVVQRLLQAGIDVNEAMQPRGSFPRIPRDGTSALMLAVESGHFQLGLLLVEAGADPNDQRSGFAPLHAISWVRKPNRGENPDGDPPPRGSGNVTDLQFVRALVAAGADVNARLDSGKGGRAVLNLRGATPLLMAAKTADVPLLRTLLDLGADPRLTNVDGTTPLMAAAGVGVRAVGEEAGSEPEVLEALQFLLDRGADVNAVDGNGETAMHGAAYRNYPRAVRFLADHGADPQVWNRKNAYGWTPVLIAQGQRPGSFKPSPETVQALQAALPGTPRGVPGE